MVDILKKELDTYVKQKGGLLCKSKGKFVLIRENDIVDVFDTKTDAIRQGYERFGNVPFLVRHIIEVETPQNFTSNLLGK